MHFNIILYNILIPSVLSAVVLLVFWQVEKFKGSTKSKYAPALGILVGYSAGYIGILGKFPELPPVDPTTGWFVYIGLATLIFAFVETQWEKKRKIVWAARASLIAVFCWFMLGPILEYQWDIVEAIVKIGAISVVSLMFWHAFDGLGRHGTPVWFGLILIELATVESIVILLSHSVLLAQLQGVLTAAVGATVVMSCIFPGVAITYAGISLVSVISIAHAISALFYADMPIWTIEFLAAAPIAAMILWRRGKGLKDKVFGFGAAVIMQILAIIITLVSFE